jgi:hypothetical protein
MSTSFRITKNRITKWTLGLAGALLLLSGPQLAGYSIDTFYPYLVIGVSMIVIGLGFLIVLSAFINQKLSLRQSQISMGICGLALLGIVAFEIPLTHSVAYPLIPPGTSSPFNLQTYSIVLGFVGIATTLMSIILISRLEKKQNLS